MGLREESTEDPRVRGAAKKNRHPSSSVCILGINWRPGMDSKGPRDGNFS